MSLLKSHPAVLASLGATAIVALVLTVLAVTMSRAGMSLRPLVFVAVFMAMVGGPQLLFHLAREFGWIPKRDLTWVPAADRVARDGYVEVEDALRAANGVFADPLAVFGPGADPDLLTDLTRLGAQGPFPGAQVAQMAILPPAGTTVVARFPAAPEAEAALERYLAAAVGVVPGPALDGARIAPRPGGDVVLALTAGRTLLVLTGPDERSLRAALAGSRIIRPARPDDAAAIAARDYWLYRPAVLAALAAMLLAGVVLWFFKGSTWAATVPAVSGAPTMTEQDLRRQLLALNDLDAPWRVAEETPGGRLVATWRYAEARWVDLARARGVRATHRVLIDLDATHRVARPTEQSSRFDWSAGPGGAGAEWKTGLGITFFQVEHQRVLGLQLDERGQFTTRLSHTWTFDLQEMKAPLIAVVTGGGWTWRPTVWHGPAWLRWLTG